jgi:hypothetical protein
MSNTSPINAYIGSAIASPPVQKQVMIVNIKKLLIKLLQIILFKTFFINNVVNETSRVPEINFGVSTLPSIPSTSSVKYCLDVSPNS